MNPPPSTEQALRELVQAAKDAKDFIQFAATPKAVREVQKKLYHSLQRHITAAEAALAAKEKPEPIFDPTLPLGLTKAELDARYLEFHNKVSREWEETYGTKWPYGPAI